MHNFPKAIKNKAQDAKRVISEVASIQKCPSCNYHKQAIVECAKHGHQQPKAEA